MYKVIRYASDLTNGVGVDCRERQVGCNEKADMHVCFEDGSGTAVCKNCLTARANQGLWRTDTARMFKAS